MAESQAQSAPSKNKKRTKLRTIPDDEYKSILETRVANRVLLKFTGIGITGLVAVFSGFYFLQQLMFNTAKTELTTTLQTNISKDILPGRIAEVLIEKSTIYKEVENQAQAKAKEAAERALNDITNNPKQLENIVAKTFDVVTQKGLIEENLAKSALVRAKNQKLQSNERAQALRIYFIFEKSEDVLRDNLEEIIVNANAGNLNTEEPLLNVAFSTYPASKTDAGGAGPRDQRALTAAFRHMESKDWSDLLESTKRAYRSFFEARHDDDLNMVRDWLSDHPDVPGVVMVMEALASTNRIAGVSALADLAKTTRLRGHVFRTISKIDPFLPLPDDRRRAAFNSILEAMPARLTNLTADKINASEPSESSRQLPPSRLEPVLSGPVRPGIEPRKPGATIDDEGRLAARALINLLRLSDRDDWSAFIRPRYLGTDSKSNETRQRAIYLIELSLARVQVEEAQKSDIGPTVDKIARFLTNDPESLIEARKANLLSRSLEKAPVATSHNYIESSLKLLREPANAVPTVEIGPLARAFGKYRTTSTPYTQLRLLIATRMNDFTEPVRIHILRALLASLSRDVGQGLTDQDEQIGGKAAWNIAVRIIGHEIDQQDPASVELSEIIGEYLMKELNNTQTTDVRQSITRQIECENLVPRVQSAAGGVNGKKLGSLAIELGKQLHWIERRPQGIKVQKVNTPETGELREEFSVSLQNRETIIQLESVRQGANIRLKSDDDVSLALFDSAYRLDVSGAGGCRGTQASELVWLAETTNPALLRIRSGSGIGQTAKILVTTNLGPIAFPSDTSRSKPHPSFIGGSYKMSSKSKDDEFWLRFEAEPGSVLRIWTADLKDGVDTELTLFEGRSGRELDSDDDGGGELASRLTYFAREGGAFIVRATTASSSKTDQSFELHIQKAGKLVSTPTSREQPEVIRFGEAAAIDKVAGKKVWFRGDLERGTVYSVQNSDSKADVSISSQEGARLPLFHVPKLVDGRLLLLKNTFVKVFTVPTSGQYRFELDLSKVEESFPSFAVEKLSMRPKPLDPDSAGIMAPLQIADRADALGFLISWDSTPKTLKFTAQKDEGMTLQLTTFERDAKLTAKVTDEQTGKLIDVNIIRHPWTALLKWTVLRDHSYQITLEGQADGGSVLINSVLGKQFIPHDGFRVGDRVILSEHEEIDGEKDWNIAMTKYVGCIAVITSLVEPRQGTPSTDKSHVNLRAGGERAWFWRTRNMRAAAPDANQPERCMAFVPS